MNRILGRYKNGNYQVTLYDDGSKVRETPFKTFEPRFAESIDFKITNYCDIGCPMCHEDSNMNGKHGEIIIPELLLSLKPYTEIAIGGGNAMSHPDILKFLKYLTRFNIIANMTVNQKHFIQDYRIYKNLLKYRLINGLGVSIDYKNYRDLPAYVNISNNIVVHCIEGMLNEDIYNTLKYKNLKLLVLGYKDFRRGEQYLTNNGKDIEKNSTFLRNKIISGEAIKDFKSISFDNLAIKRLGCLKEYIGNSYDLYYMGDDGQFTFYIDAVNKEFALNSISKERFRMTNNANEMFTFIRNKYYNSEEK